MALEDAGKLPENVSPPFKEVGMVLGEAGMGRSFERIDGSLTRMKLSLTRIEASFTRIKGSPERIIPSLTRISFVLTWTKNILVGPKAIPDTKVGKETGSRMKRIKGFHGLKSLKHGRFSPCNP